MQFDNENTDISNFKLKPIDMDERASVLEKPMMEKLLADDKSIRQDRLVSMKEDHSMKLKSRDFKELISLVEEKLIEKSIKLS